MLVPREHLTRSASTVMAQVASVAADIGGIIIATGHLARTHAFNAVIPLRRRRARDDA
jgi:hypothetical protein